MEDKIKEKRAFSGNLQNLYTILIWIRERLSKYFNQKELEKIELASEEAIVNIIKHGYQNKIGRIEVEILVNQVLEISFKDKGPKFNPILHKKKPNKKASLHERKEGGHGIMLIFECVDEVFYTRKDSYNILTLRKKRSLNY